MVDLDSTVTEVYGKTKHGTSYGYTGVLGYHPLIATRAGTGEILGSRLCRRRHNRDYADLRVMPTSVSDPLRGAVSGLLMSA